MNPNQVSIGGEYLKDSISVQVYNYKSPQNMSGFTVEFTVIKGGGKVDQQIVKTKATGKASTRWKLGKDSFKQIVTARVTDPEGNVLPETQIIAHGILYNAWNEVDYIPFSNLIDLAADTLIHQSWMVSANMIYKRGVNFLDWQIINEPKIKGAREIEIDKNGVIYIGTWFGELYKSSDHGLIWIKCSNPIPDRPYYFFLTITLDGDLWATDYEHGLWHSKDGGFTWNNPSNGADINTLIYNLFRLKNNCLIAMVEPPGKRPAVMKSNDEGKTWMPLTTPENSFSCFITSNEEIVVFAQTSSISIYKSIDLGKTFKQAYSVPISFSTSSMFDNYHKIGPDYYLVIPSHGLLKTRNFEQFETILSEQNVNGLFFDHTGSIWVGGGQRTYIFNQD